MLFCLVGERQRCGFSMSLSIHSAAQDGQFGGAFRCTDQYRAVSRQYLCGRVHRHRLRHTFDSVQTRRAALSNVGIAQGRGRSI